MLVLRKCGLPVLAAAAILVFGNQAGAQLTPIFTDTFDVSVNTSDINLELASRQSGSVVSGGPISYVTSTADPATDYRHQMFEPGGAQVLQLAEDGFNQPGAAPIFSYKAMVSPDLNFNPATIGSVVKRVTFQLDVGLINTEFGTFTNAGITVGGDSPLTDNDSEIVVQTASDNGVQPVFDNYFSAVFMDDQFGGGGDFMQAVANGSTIFDNTGCIGCFLTHIGGNDVLNVQIDFDDPNDGNPWDGVGSTTIAVSVDGDPVRNPNDGTPYVYEVLNGGLTNNYITLWGNRQTNNNFTTLTTHSFDNLQVWAESTGTTLMADFNGDGTVDLLDLDILGSNFGLDPATMAEGDANGDGVVDLLDLDILGGEFGMSAAASIPEPSALALLGLSCFAFARRRRAGA